MSFFFTLMRTILLLHLLTYTLLNLLRKILCRNAPCFPDLGNQKRLKHVHIQALSSSSRVG
ncbi:MAG: hypothetical protein PHF70_06365 [Opitutales bacterium]|nr:hypothetical protein [Opitutales bacterium]